MNRLESVLGIAVHGILRGNASTGGTMKSARERAAEHIRFADDYEGSQLTSAQLIERLAESFKEHARDQRRACAEAVCAVANDYADNVVNTHTLADRAHALVMNTPAPGEGR